ncbi:MAG: hypothetical protein JNM43_15120 [Planctomycetaceae bacterium]|nr:hypothetical protein [Planctomycetaceae bacterium]
MRTQPTLPLFVDTNVLFVGTMNEDETTQTLSDKVIDRANVLRFGCPSDLSSVLDDVTGDGKPKPSTNLLPYKSWKSWIKSVENGAANDVLHQSAGIIERLNSALRLVGRPFAHRTFKSMLAYVANYPDVVADSHQTAISDQIEMKILPKLRGVDLTENRARQALAELQSIIEDLNDQELLEALKLSIRDSEHAFTWRGVDRTQQV